MLLMIACIALTVGQQLTPDIGWGAIRGLAEGGGKSVVWFKVLELGAVLVEVRQGVHDACLSTNTSQAGGTRAVGLWLRKHHALSEAGTSMHWHASST